VWLATRDGDDRLSVPPKQTFPIRIPNEQLQTALGQTGSFTFPEANGLRRLMG
jgi:hypothetical protein